MSKMEEDSGTLTPISSTASTAIETQTNGLLFPSPQKSPIINPETPSSLTVPHTSRPRERRSFSSAQKLPVLEPSQSPVRKRFDFLLLWILQTVTWAYISITAFKRRIMNFVWGVWYDWHSWPWWGGFMIKRDVGRLEKVPRHLAVILGERKMKREYDADEILRRAVEVANWC